ncbi:hypothetical protein EW146_g151 [Bondarzewia mesenterica]|uniref:Uncharacterized protein n=1 Tax=Bondarzewia mesenterica TaxID=1095465 RepID=A0A4S4M9H4_9AGAM|nr:hypothetical protein EW146_g151 [Bondarzewia mesenterica]
MYLLGAPPASGFWRPSTRCNGAYQPLRGGLRTTTPALPVSLNLAVAPDSARKMKLTRTFCPLTFTITLGSLICIIPMTLATSPPGHAMNDKSPSFSVEFDDAVAMHIADSVHYELHGEEGAQEWANLLPPGGHVVHVGDEEYTVTMFHQLQCLDIIRKEYIMTTTQPPSTLTVHCMNYLRQTILCQSNLRLESVKSPTGQASRTYDTACRDWTKVYEEAERNHETNIAGRD